MADSSIYGLKIDGLIMAEYCSYKYVARLFWPYMAGYGNIMP